MNRPKDTLARRLTQWWTARRRLARAARIEPDAADFGTSWGLEMSLEPPSRPPGRQHAATRPPTGQR